MFLLRARLRKECQLLDIMTSRGERIFNEILAEDGHTLRILIQKEFMAKGSIKPARSEHDEDEVVPDSFYVFLLYERTEGCPIVAGSTIVPPGRRHNVDGAEVTFKKSISDEDLNADDVEIVVPEPTRKRAKASKNDVPGKKKAAGKVNANGVDLDGVPDFMMNIAGDPDNITAVRRDRSGVKGISVGGKSKAAEAPPPEPAPPAPPKKATPKKKPSTPKAAAKPVKKPAPKAVAPAKKKATSSSSAKKAGGGKKPGKA